MEYDTSVSVRTQLSQELQLLVYSATKVSFYATSSLLCTIGVASYGALGLVPLDFRLFRGGLLFPVTSEQQTL